MVKKIDRKIVAYKVKTRDEPQDAPTPQDDVVHMHETVLRPERLMGTTYKLKTPEHVSELSLFITINDIILNEGTVHETRRPFEIFINSKSLEHYQWIVALTRIISAVFRKGGDVTFLVEELRSVFDPKGGYWNKGKYVPSLIAACPTPASRISCPIASSNSREPFRGASHAAPTVMAARIICHSQTLPNCVVSTLRQISGEKTSPQPLPINPP